MPMLRLVLLVTAALVWGAAECSAATPSWESSRLLVGRSHPLLVHFPVALLLVAGLLELWGAVVGRTQRSPAARTCLAFGALAAAVAAFSGWTWADREPLSALLEERLFLHRWAGVAVAGTAVLAWVALGASQEGTRTGLRRLGRLALALCVGAVMFAGHEGGEMARGEAFLNDAIDEFMAGEQPPAPELPAPAPVVASEPADGAEPAVGVSGVDFARDVAPIFAERCQSCHGPSKQKGGVRLDRRDEALFALHDGQAVIVPGAPESSEMIHVVSLPADDLDIMPAEGEPLSAAQIATLREWIAQGARWPGE